MAGIGNPTGAAYLGEVKFNDIFVEKTGIYRLSGYAFLDCIGLVQSCENSQDFLKLYLRHSIQIGDLLTLTLDFAFFEEKSRWRYFEASFEARSTQLKVIFIILII